MDRPPPYGIERIVTGGQTGVDRAAWDAARACGIPIGGYVPKGRMAEDGPIAADYGFLSETESAKPAKRTRKNVENSDKTLILTRGPITGGTALTAQIAAKLGKPCLITDLGEFISGAKREGEPSPDAEGLNKAAEHIGEWLAVTPGAVLNVAGPRASKDSEIYSLAREVLMMSLRGKVAIRHCPNAPSGLGAASCAGSSLVRRS